MGGRGVEHGLVMRLRVAEGGVRIGEGLIEIGVSRPFLLQLLVQLRLADGGFADRRVGVRQLLLEGLARGLRVDELRRESRLRAA